MCICENIEFFTESLGFEKEGSEILWGNLGGQSVMRVFWKQEGVKRGDYTNELGEFVGCLYPFSTFVFCWK